MKLFLVAFAVIAAVAADILPSDQYLPPVQQELQPLDVPSSEYLPPGTLAIQGQLSDDGYRYKTQRRVVLRRQRRDVNELPSNDYLPPVQEEPLAYASPAIDYSSTLLGNQGDLSADGYRYKTNRRVVLRRHRRDVNELPSNEYLPPVQISQPLPSNEYLPPVQAVQNVQTIQPIQPIQSNVVVEPAHELAADGYRYKTHRRVVLRRHRRDVNELPSNDYLPPVQEEPLAYASPAIDYSSTLLGNQGDLSVDGYRYKTNRRVVLRRHRRDVNELPSNEYLPPVQISQPLPSNEYLPPVQAVQNVQTIQPIQSNVVVEPAHELAADGYRYKTHRRVVLRRHRRDVNELPSNEYLPPVQISQPLPSNEYLPPVQAVQNVQTIQPIQPIQPIQSNVVVEPAHELAADGYRYKTHRRVVLRRHRRDVNELPSNEYLPPVQISQPLPSNEYLPPVQTIQPIQPVQPLQPIQPVQSNVVVEPAHELAADGYRYKTHRRVVLRRRH